MAASGDEVVSGQQPVVSAMPQQKLKIDLLATPEVSASVLFGFFDVFAAAGRDWPTLIEGRPAESPFEVRVVATQAEPMQVANGVWLKPDATLGDRAPADIVCVPEVALSPDATLAGRFDAEIAWLQRCYAAHSTLATACSGALLLGEAGLLEGRDATTHWLFCDVLSKYRGVRVHPKRALVHADDGRLVMAGGGTGWQDLALYLVARYASVDTAMQVARLFLVNWHDVGQQPFAMLTCNQQVDDAVIRDCQMWIAQRYETATPVQAMIKHSGLTERTFNRRFRQATGMTPMQYVHVMRLEESKVMLETSTDPIEAVAQDVGYEDASSFSRLFRRHVGLTPGQYRKRFGKLRKTLQLQTAPRGHNLAMSG